MAEAPPMDIERTQNRQRIPQLEKNCEKISGIGPSPKNASKTALICKNDRVFFFILVRFAIPEIFAIFSHFFVGQRKCCLFQIKFIFVRPL